MRLDIVTNDAGELVRREHARDLGGGVVVALYRLARLAQVHDLTNQAFLRQLEEVAALIRDYCLRAGSDVNILFAKRAVFVAGQLLKGSRGAYESASELGDILERCGGAELSIHKDVAEDELRAFAEAISASARSRGESAKGYRSPSGKIRLRAVNDAARLRGLELETMEFEQRVVRTYASAVVIMRRFYEDMKEGRYALPKRVKRIAQMLVDLSEGSTPAFLGVTEARNANHDDAGRAVNTAILSVSVAREMTDDRAILAQVAMAAMMFDVGRPRALALAAASGSGSGGGQQMTGVAPRLSEDAEDKLPAGTAAVLTALGRVNEPTITRTVIAFEAMWLRRSFLGPVYGGVRQPTLQAKIVALARRYNDLLTPEPGVAAPLPDFAVATIAEECKEASDRTALRMLVCALGLFPVGTIVQLSTNEVGEVLPGNERAAGDKPRLRLVMDARGDVLDNVVEVDLAKPRAGEPARHITKVLGVDGWKKGLDAPAAPSSGARQGKVSARDAEVVASSRKPASAVPPRPLAKSEEEPPADVPDSERISESPSVASIGTSPSAVAEAVGRFMTEPPRPVGLRGDRTVVAPPAFAEAELRRAKFSLPPNARATARDPLKDRTPTAKGSLAATPLVHVLVYMLDHALSGTVVFREPEGEESFVYFLEGAAAKVKTHRRLAFLGDELVAAGLVARDVVDKALESAKRLGVLLGEYLIGNGLMAEEPLYRALTTQLRKKVASMANLSADTTYTFFRDVNALEAWAGERLTPCHPIDVILNCVRGWYDRARIHATLTRIGKQELVLHPEVDLAALKLTDEEEVVLAVIRGEHPPLADLFSRKVADEDAISSLVYALAVTRQFAFPNQKGLPMARKHADVERAAAEAGDRVSALPFSAVIEPSAKSRRSAAEPSAEVVIQKSASTWRPPPAPPAAPESQEVDVDFEWDNDAAKSEQHSESDTALQAMTDFRLAETALHRGDVPMAERLALRAVEGDAGQVDYPALLAWIRSLSGTPQALGDSIASLTQLLAKDPRHERALLYRGQLSKRAGRLKEALKDFERILETNPQHREAASEARLLRARLMK